MNKTIFILAENLFSLSYLINNYFQEHYSEDTFYLKSTISLLYKNSGDLHYEISKLCAKDEIDAPQV